MAPHVLVPLPRRQPKLPLTHGLADALDVSLEQMRAPLGHRPGLLVKIHLVLPPLFGAVTLAVAEAVRVVAVAAVFAPFEPRLDFGFGFGLFARRSVMVVVVLLRGVEFGRGGGEGGAEFALLDRVVEAAVGEEVAVPGEAGDVEGDGLLQVGVVVGQVVEVGLARGGFGVRADGPAEAAGAVEVVPVGKDGREEGGEEEEEGG